MNSFYTSRFTVSPSGRLIPFSLFACILMLCGLLSINTANASHVVGSDVTYKCTSTPGVFEITLVIYRNCDGGIELCTGGCGSACSMSGPPGSPNPAMRIFGADPGCSNTLFGSINLDLQSVKDVNINPECPNAKSTCNNMGCYTGPPGTYTPGIERYEFKGFANLGPTSGIPANCCNVRLSWELCCRNAQIATGGAGANFYIDAVVNRCLSVSPCNSSPTLDNDPFAVMCGGENYVFNNGAIDPDLDSLTFAFAPALEGFGDPVNYDPPWAFNKPMPWTGQPGGQFPAGIHCDPAKGDIMFTPQNTSGNNWYGIMAVEVKQWKTINGVPTVIGITRRDIQMVVLGYCDPNNSPRFNTEPAANSNPNVPKYDWDICAGEQLCFNIIAKDTDFLPPTISDTTFLDWNKALARYGATFLPTYNPANRRKPAPLGGPREDKYQFCWTPTDDMASNNPYYFTVSAKDNRCPNPGRITRAFSVKVWARPDLTIVPNNLKCGKFSVTYTNNKPKFPPSSIIWQISSVPGDYSMTQNPYLFTSQTTPVMNFTEGGKYLVMLQANSPGPSGGLPCTRVFYDTIRVDTVVKPFVRDTITCRGQSVQISAVAKYGTPLYTYYWYNSIKDTLLPALNAPVFASSSLTVTPSNTRRYTIKVRDINGCYRFDSLQVAVKELPVGILPDSTRLCHGTSYELDAGNNSGNIRKWSWNVGDTTQKITRNDSGIYIVTLTDTFNCQQVDTMKLFVNRQIFPDAGVDTSICSGDTMTLIGKGGYIYQWKDLGTGSVIPGNKYDGTVKITPTNTASANKYEVTVYTIYPDTTAKYKECSLADTISITVKPLPVLIQPQPVQACRYENLVILTPFGTNQGGGTGVWSYPQSPAAVVANTQVRVDSLKNIPLVDSNTTQTFTNWIRYKYTAPQSFGGCSQRDSARVVIYATPRVNAGPKLIWCSNAGVYTINVANQHYVPSGGSSAEGEEWTGNGVYPVASGSNNRYYFDPNLPAVLPSPGINIVRYKYTKTYNPTLSNQISCENHDTVLFTVSTPPVIDAGQDVIACDNEAMFNIIGKQTAGNKANTIPATGKSFWTPGSPAINIKDGPLKDSINFDPGNSAVVITSGPTVSYKLYYNDISTGCPVRDSMTLRIARSPKASLRYLNSTADSPYVCITGGKQVFFSPMITSPTGAWIEAANGSNLVYKGSPSFGANSSGTPSRAVFNSNGATEGRHTFSMNYTDISTSAGCSITAANEIVVLSQPTIQVTTPPAICSYDGSSPVQLAQDPGVPFKWKTTGDGAFDNDSVQSTSYKIGLTDMGFGQVVLTAETQKRIFQPGTNGDQCAIATSTATLMIVKAPDAEVIGTDTQGCVPSLTSTYTAGPTNIITPVAYKWEWENEPSRVEPATTSISRTIDDYDVKMKGRYRVRLTVGTSSNGKDCNTQSRWAQMITHATPTSDFITNPTVTTIAKPFFNFINQSSVMDNSGMNYKWNLGPGPDPKKPEDRIVKETNPSNIEYAADTASKKVWLTVTSEHGCIDSTSRPIRIDPDITVFIPNAFRPDDANGRNSMVDCDGDLDCNRVFKVAANGHLSIEIFVYNRWGQQVFFTNDAKIGWNGRVEQKGELCPQDVYSYHVMATSFSGKKYKYSGTVTLLR